MPVVVWFVIIALRSARCHVVSFTTLFLFVRFNLVISISTTLAFFMIFSFLFFFFSSRRRHTRYIGDWSSDVCSSDLFRSRVLDSQVATVVGFGLLLVSLPTLLSLWHVWDVRGAVPPGGLLGELISGGLRTGFNLWGANLVTVALLVTALFMTTRFSFSGAHAWASGPNGPIGRVEKLGILQKAQARWHAWREEREQQRMRRRVEEARLSGRKPVPPQLIGKAELLNEASKTIRL